MASVMRVPPTNIQSARSSRRTTRSRHPDRRQGERVEVNLQALCLGLDAVRPALNLSALGRLGLGPRISHLLALAANRYSDALIWRTVMRTQVEKGRLFQELHQRRGILILPNPWDAGTAKLLASIGFEALATTSLGMSNALGRVDAEGSVSRAELLENCRVIAEATDLPVSADLENGYADDPEQAGSDPAACAWG